LIRHKENGYVYQAGNVEDLKNGLEYVLASGSRLQAMGQKSLETINGWGLEQDVQGLHYALHAIVDAK
jgi:hypothetical protein